MKKSNRCIKAKQGFTLIEVLVSLFCLSLCLLLFIGVCEMMNHYPVQDLLSDDVIAVRQIRFILAQGEDITLTSDSISFRYHQDDVLLTYHNHRLVKTPGYEIFLKDIINGTFYEKGGCIYAGWKRARDYEALLYCE